MSYWRLYLASRLRAGDDLRVHMNQVTGNYHIRGRRLKLASISTYKVMIYWPDLVKDVTHCHDFSKNRLVVPVVIIEADHVGDRV